jgi:glycosyltransferase involved in cell wall biosynthesis
MELKELKVLMISTDRNILQSGSAVSERMKEYGDLVGELHIVLLSKSLEKLKETSLSKNVWVYPTNSSTKWLYPFSASSLGKKIIFDKKFTRGKSLITTQDPFECGWAGLQIKNKWRIPLEVQLHTNPYSEHFSGSLNFIRKIIAKKVIKNADHIRVVSQSVGDIIQTKFSISPKTISVLPIYIDKERIENGHITFDLHARFGWHFILLLVARLTEEKNVGMALKVLQKILAFFPDTGLVIVGAGPEESKLKSLSKSLKVDSHVAFVGWQEDLASYYRSANAFIQTSYFEGYGLALVEAGLSGLPVVTTAVGIANDLENGKDAFVCPVGDVEYMFKAVYDLIENNQKREGLKINLRHTLESKLLSKADYLKKLGGGWLETASKVHE